MDATFHQSDERLELYALNRLSDADVIGIEEHLMVCESCRDRLDEAAAFGYSIREELRQNPHPFAVERDWLGWLRGGWMKPGFALAGALAVAVLAVMLFRGAAPQLPAVATLQLTAMRGAEVQSVAQARELDLTFEDVPAGSTNLSVEVVTAGGAPVFNGVPAASNGTAAAKVTTVVSPGDYFARVYDSQSHLLHEYAFRVR